jgi:hypothetical protein
MDLAIEDEQPAPVFLPRKRAFVVGVDLGQQSDPSAVAVIERIDGVFEYGTPWERHTGTGTIPQQKARRFDVRYLQRLPLKLPYPQQVARIAALMARPPLCGGDGIPRATVVADGTGVGRPVLELLDRAGVESEKVLITGSEDQDAYRDGMWRVSKALIVQQIDAYLHNGELRFAKRLAEAEQVAVELKAFSRFVSATGRSSWEARGSAHDDLVLSVGLALWWAARPPQTATAVFGSY